MDRFSQKENILLGYSLQRPVRHSDVDFHDVFGGPPRRSSMQEMRYSSGETMNSSNNTIQGEEDKDLPVFGEEAVNRRRYPSDDFFDDIFKGDEPLSSPRRSDRDPFGSTPGSQVLSPARSLPARADPFGSSLPAHQFQLSLPAKLTKAIDFPAFASGNQSPNYKDPTSNGANLYTPSSPLSRLSSEAFQEEDELRNEIRPSYRPSPLSNEFSVSSKESSSHKTKSDESELTEKGSASKKDLKSTEAPNNSNQFHFSIYKWASKGIPLLMPLRGGNSSKSREKIKTERCSSSNGRIESDNWAGRLQTAIWPDSVGRKQEKSSFHETSTEDRIEPCHIVEEAVLSMPGSKFINIVPNIVETGPDDDAILSEEREEIKPHTSSEISMTTEEAQKPELKPLHSLFYDTNVGQGNDGIIKKSEAKNHKVKKTAVSHSNADGSKRKNDGKKINSSRAEVIQVNEPLSQGSSRTSGDNLGRNGVKGKVKEFVKVFDQAATSKPKIDIETQSQSSPWEGSGTCGAANEVRANTTQTNGKNHIHNVRKMKTPPNASVMVDKNLADSEKQQSYIKIPVFSASGNSFGQKDASESSSESLPDGSKVTFGNIDDLFQENFMVKELSDEQDKLSQIGEGSDDIQTWDAKIRQWSNGKKGNIRSLLSTLQYVLWPGSGWKPVPLVDIIEGSAVKKAYQKALLYLHPDKLQQKGAASHQKYIAEKVFDILQEAWDHFNTLGVI